MAPESPHRLVVLDFCQQLSHGFGLKVDRFESGVADAFLRVSWAAIQSRDDGYVPVGNGVAHVSVPAWYEHFQYEAATRPSSDQSRITWTENTESGYLMLVAVQPAGWALEEMLEGAWPEEAKEFHGRMAVSWIFPEGMHGRVKLTWRLRELAEEGILDACAHVNDSASGNLHHVPDYGEAPREERRRNAENAPQPIRFLPEAAADPEQLRNYYIYADNVTIGENKVEVRDTAGGVIVQQVQDASQHFDFSHYDHQALAAELETVAQELRQRFPEDGHLPDLERAAAAARDGDADQLRSRLRRSGEWVLAAMKEIVPELAASAIKAALRLP